MSTALGSHFFLVPFNQEHFLCFHDLDNVEEESHGTPLLSVSKSLLA